MMDEHISEHITRAVECKNCGWVYIEDVEIIDEYYSSGGDRGEKETLRIEFKCKYCNEVGISKIITKR